MRPLVLAAGVLFYAWGSTVAGQGAPARKDLAPYQFRTERGWLRMPDGVRLAVTWCRPSHDGAASSSPCCWSISPTAKTTRFTSEISRSNGRVGMWGIFWGGFNSIQVAMRRPPALKAILAIAATDDLYHDAAGRGTRRCRAASTEPRGIRQPA